MGQYCTTGCRAPQELTWEQDSLATNAAFVFIKPHAVCKSVEDLVEERFARGRISVSSSGYIEANQIDSMGLIDRHYGSIASRAMRQKPKDLVVQPEAKDAFEKLFGLSWDEALLQGRVHNAADAARVLGISSDDLGKRCDCAKADELKFGSGFYVAKIEDTFVVNGFYPRMRSKYTAPGKRIKYYEVEWEAALLPWIAFRKKVIGVTNPQDAVDGSLRREIFRNWSPLGLEAEPNSADNAVHASASPFEALCERANWLRARVSEDPFFVAMTKAGVNAATISAWMGDPAVLYEGKRQSLFELLEELDSKACVMEALRIATGSR